MHRSKLLQDSLLLADSLFVSASLAATGENHNGHALAFYRPVATLTLQVSLRALVEVLPWENTGMSTVSRVRSVTGMYGEVPATEGNPIEASMRSCHLQ